MSNSSYIRGSEMELERIGLLEGMLGSRFFVQLDRKESRVGRFTG